MADIKAKFINSKTTKVRVGQVGAIKVLSQQTGSTSKLSNLSDVDLTQVDESGLILVYNSDTSTFFLTDVIQTSTFGATGVVTFTNATSSSSPSTGAFVVEGGTGIGGNLNVGQNVNVSQDINITGITTLASNGGITTTGGNLFVNDNFSVGNNLFVSGISTFDDVVQINSDLSLSGNVIPGIGVSYVSGNFSGPNGIAFFNSDGSLLSTASTTGFITTSNYILTTQEIAGTDTPVWTTTIDGGEF